MSAEAPRLTIVGAPMAPPVELQRWLFVPSKSALAYLSSPAQ